MRELYEQVCTVKKDDKGNAVGLKIFITNSSAIP
jgi:hypothetical protein